MSRQPLRVGRYVLFDVIASGGMASVHIGRLQGPVGFARTVAVKRLHTHLSHDPEFVSMFLDEARLAARIQHPNVVATIDVVAQSGELFLVMDYVQGDSLSQLWKRARERNAPPPLRVVSSVMTGALYGLHAAHEATTERGEPLDIVHRDVSPQNILLGVDGVARVVDFGVAKAVSRLQSTRDGQVKGKLSYMAPEQILRKRVDRRADLYAAGVVLWEALAGRKLFEAEDAAAVIAAVLEGNVPRLSTINPEVTEAVDALIRVALAREPEDRYATALELAAALEDAAPPAPQRAVVEWMSAIASDRILERKKLLVAIEQTPSDTSIEVPADLALPAGRLEGRRFTEEETSQLVEHATQTTALSTTSSVTRSRGRRWVGGLVVLALAGAAVFFVQTRVVKPASVSTAPTTMSSSLSIAATTSVSASPPPTTTGAIEPSATASAIVASVPTAPTARPHITPSATATHKATSCDPPYVIDASGVKRFKPGCI